MTGGDRVRRLSGDPPSPWEAEFGYSRVVVAGGFALISGVTSAGPDGVALGETPYEQATECFAKILRELSRVSVRPEDVVSVRIYVTDISRGAEVGRALHDALGDTRPAATMVEVSGLLDPRMLVEIEATAVAPTTMRHDDPAPL